jgi:3-deoxy-D-manno-octulosonic-acid transferase
VILLYRALVSFIYRLAWPFVRIKANRGSALWKGRLLDSLPDKPVDLWLHAASVGETRMAAILIGHLRRHHPDIRIHTTVMTEAGFETAEKLLAEKSTVSFFPLDIAPLMRRLAEALQPKAIVIAETEIWPNMVRTATEHDIPLILINGRMSEKAFGRYRRIRGTMKALLARYTRLFLRSEEDRKRFAYFGVTPEQMVVVGDMKFDAPLMPRSEGRRREIRFRAGLPETVPVLVAGSTRPGEEALVLAGWQQWSKVFPNLHLMIAPRHPDRRDEIIGLLQQSDVSFRLYGSEKSDSRRVILVDRMGLLTDLYLTADLAFVGGTLVPIGGHNVLEPVWAGTPVIFGPHTANVAEAVAYIAEHNYGACAADGEEMTRLIHEFFAGRRAFARKTEADLDRSATADAGRFILTLLDARGAGRG